MIILVVLPSIQHEFIRLTGGREMMRELPYKISANLKVWAMSTFSPEILEHVKRYISDWETAVAISSDWAKETLVLWGERFFSQIGTWTSWVMDLILIPFYLFFLLTSLNRFWSYAQNTMIPYDHHDLILRILAKVHRSLSAFFRGRLLVCLIISVSAWMGLLFLGVPFSFILGFGIGFATIVPLMGIVFLVPAMIAYSLVGAGVEEQALLLLLYAALQGMEMFVLTPFILGKEVELHPMALVMSILICGYLFGGIGVVLAVPIASTAKILFEEFVFPSFVELSKKHPNSPKVNPRKGSS
jgi:predicted PurR-regulated permease PerM